MIRFDVILFVFQCQTNFTHLESEIRILKPRSRSGQKCDTVFEVRGPKISIAMLYSILSRIKFCPLQYFEARGRIKNLTTDSETVIQNKALFRKLARYQSIKNPNVNVTSQPSFEGKETSSLEQKLSLAVRRFPFIPHHTFRKNVQGQDHLFTFCILEWDGQQGSRIQTAPMAGSLELCLSFQLPVPDMSLAFCLCAYQSIHLRQPTVLLSDDEKKTTMRVQFRTRKSKFSQNIVLQKPCGIPTVVGINKGRPEGLQCIIHRILLESRMYLNSFLINL